MIRASRLLALRRAVRETPTRASADDDDDESGGANDDNDFDTDVKKRYPNCLEATLSQKRLAALMESSQPFVDVFCILSGDKLHTVNLANELSICYRVASLHSRRAGTACVCGARARVSRS